MELCEQNYQTIELFVNKLKEKFQHLHVGNVIGELCEESITEFCSPTNDDVDILSRKSINYDYESHTKKQSQLFEEMCENYGDVILNEVIGQYFFRQYDKFLPRLKDALEGKDTDLYQHWELFLNILRHKVREEINKVKNSNDIEFKGDFPNKLEYTLVEQEALENVGDCYYKEYSGNFFLRYYFKKRDRRICYRVKNH